jgi:hypothetical protein
VSAEHPAGAGHALELCDIGTVLVAGGKRGCVEVLMALRDEIDKIQKVLKVNEKSMVSPDRELFHSILNALKDIEEGSHPKVLQVGDSGVAA